MAEVKQARNINTGRVVIFLLIVVVVSLLIARVFSITSVWNTILLRPMLNFLVLMSHYFLGNFGIAIIVLTILMRLLILPLTMRQLRSSRALQAIQPQIREVRKKYANDNQKIGQEIMRLYKEEGVNPVGCFYPMLLQLPIWVALYQSVAQALAYTPENLVGLDKQLYSLTALKNALPLNSHFLWLNLSNGDIPMIFLVGGSVWVLQQMAFVPSPDRGQESMSRIAMYAMPLLFGFLAFTLPSGLSLYWVTSNIIGMIMQYGVTGWGTLKMPSLAFLNRSARTSGHGLSARAQGKVPTAGKVAKVSTSRQAGTKDNIPSSPKKESFRSDKVSEPEECGHDKGGGRGKD